MKKRTIKFETVAEFIARGGKITKVPMKQKGALSLSRIIDSGALPIELLKFINGR